MVEHFSEKDNTGMYGENGLDNKGIVSYITIWKQTTFLFYRF